MSAPWIKHALIGVSAKVAFAGDGEFGALLQKVASSNDEPALVFARAAGAVAACRRAAVTIASKAIAIPPAAQADANALDASHPWFEALASTFSDGPARLQFEACLRLAAIGATLPHTLLQRALDAGTRNVALRDLLHPVIGNRGRWLAGFNPDWRFAAEAAVTPNDAGTATWEEGSLAQRVAYLRSLRSKDPAAARALLHEQLDQLPAKERVELASVLAERLDDADEPLLVALLKDRSRDVRDVAARLLARMPNSAHAQRVLAWLAPLLTEKRGLLRRSWQLEAPQAADPQWQSAAIEAKRPQHDRLGERAWWLYQLVRQVPLAWWSAHTAMTPADLVAWSKKTDWTEALFRGWRERAATGDAEWIEALLQSGNALIAQDAAALLAKLPPAAREKYWPDTIGGIYKAGALAAIMGSFARGETLSLRISQPLLDSIAAAFATDAMRNDYGLRAHAIELSTILHPDSLMRLQSVARRDDETPALAECIHDFERIIAIRRTLHSSPRQ